MSMHRSLFLSEKDKKQRSVLKRIERIRTLMEKGEWKEGDKVYGLPKIKTLRIKIKKEKVKKAEAVVTEGALAEAQATEAKATEAKAETPPKGPAPKEKEQAKK